MYFKSIDLSRKSCVDILQIVIILWLVVSYDKKQNENVKLAHCFMHREVLVKTIWLELQQVLNEIIKMVIYVKTRALKSKIFENCCKKIGAQNTNIILLTEIRWLSIHFSKLKDELIITT